ncbi:MAG TPA: DUF4197 domain-containing protein [Steroidobacteraceae bacterium]|nr:DUF4197 domain-containing protein [Steroidobacteraceae bacterium]
MRPIPRRQRASATTFLALILASGAALTAAATLDALSPKDAAGGLRAALSQGVGTAVSQLGANNGFLNDPRVAIPLPPALEKAERALRMFGMSDEADELRVTMNHAAEQAVSQARPIFEDALRHMTLADAREILGGGEDAGTQYFRRATGTQLSAKFRPIVAGATARLALASKYDQLAGKAASFGLISQQEANLDDYVTARALDGLFSRIADEERAIRKDPLGQANALIRKVFGSL